MRQFFLPPTLGFSILLFTGGMDRQTFFSTPSSPAAFIPQSAVFGAGRVPEEVLAALAPQRVQWLQMTVRQKMWGNDPFESVGRFSLGTEERRRVEFEITVDGKTTKTVLISDGRSFQRSHQIDGVNSLLEKCVLAKEEDFPNPASLPHARQIFLNERGCGGLHPLLSQIFSCLVNPTQQSGLWRERRVLRLSGMWNATEVVLNTLPANLRARSCNLYLDPETLWPHRIEWVGSERPQDQQVILLEMEFSEPVINHPLTSAQCARLFKID